MSKKYTKEHEWIEQRDGSWRVGITHYAQEQLGDVVMVDLPAIGQAFKAGDECMAIESVKAASDIYCPLDGEVSAVNDALNDNPALVNESPEAEGWLFDLTAAGDAPDDLMDEAAYLQYVEEL